MPTGHRLTPSSVREPKADLFLHRAGAETLTDDELAGGGVGPSAVIGHVCIPP
jgi:hypothetical protein